MIEEGLLTSSELKTYYRVKEYTNYFKKEELEGFEDKIFGDISRKKRIVFEYNRLKREIKSYPNRYVGSLNQLLKIESLMQVIDFDSSVLDQISLDIVKTELENDIPIRLYSAIPKLEIDYEYLIFQRKNKGSSIKKSR